MQNFIEAGDLKVNEIKVRLDKGEFTLYTLDVHRG